MWRQAYWDEPLITEFRGKGRQGYLIPKEDLDVEVKLPDSIRRTKDPELPEVTELEVVRHFIRLSQMSFGVDTGMMPLGSCTMKYNPKIEEESGIAESIHPLQDQETVQGNLEVMYEMQRWLAEATGMDQCSLQVPAGSAGELAGVLMMKKYHIDLDRERGDMLVADSAHGTNPASAAMAGFNVIYIKSNTEGLVDMKVLRETVSENVAGFMLTNPNTLGLFEENIKEIADLIHSVDGVLYYDGANLNGILGVARPGDMGFDIVHLNLHKTFGVPHGGGGPGAGAICAKGKMTSYLPFPVIERDGNNYVQSKPDRTIGKISVFHGNFGNLMRSYVYILGLGEEGISMIGKMSTIATNYLIAKLRNVNGLELMAPHRFRKHEVVFSAKRLADETGVTAFDIAKSLLDRGFYAPTIYFPPNVEEALMIEPTETETVETLDQFAEAIKDILEKAYSNSASITSAPHNTSVGRLDQVKANHPSTLTPTYRVLKTRLSSQRGD